jgi:serine/threonine-protein kinase RsbW
MAVTLRIPADPAYVRLARLVASGYAAQVGGTVDDIEDVRTVVDELCSMLVAHAEEGDELDLRLAADDDVVRATVAASLRRRWDPDELAEGVVKVLADSYEAEVSDGRAVLVVEKRLESLSA